MKSIDPDFADLSNEQLAKIDSICSKYESQRKKGTKVSIEAMVHDAPIDIRSSLQWELIQIEMEILDDWDQLSSSQELEKRFPEQKEPINDFWNYLRGQTHRAERKNSLRETVAETTSVGSTCNDGGAASNEYHKDDIPLLPVDSSSRFRIISNLAEGGIGTVFVAFDQDLQREVALKELKRKFANDLTVVKRFELEASVTGNLEHPNIVPIYATGKRSDGRPYYAMRLVRGKSMAAVIADLHSQQGLDLDLHKNIALRDLLFRFVTVCRAVGFAHSRGILHRDLKPSNVMIGDYGETLVVDWGLARSLNQANSDLERSHQPDSSEIGENHGTLDGTVIGTPGFMSPEQSLGHTEKLTIASDIYSLGATLVQILTHEVPYWHTGVQIPAQPNDLKHLDKEIAPPDTKFCVENHIRHGAQHPLDSMVKLPAALDAICRKSTQFEPLQRYANAELLANDLEAWLLGEPVSVLPETSLQKARRWARRNPAKVATGLASLVFAMIAMGITLSILSFKNESLRQSNEREQLATREAQKLATIAKRSGEEALRQRERVLAILKKFLFDVEQGLSDVPGSAAVQKNVLTTVLQQLGEVSAEFSDDTQVSESNVMALIELGDLFSRVNTEDIALNLPGWQEASLSPLGAAAAMYAEALKIEKELLIADPKRSQRILALIQTKQADIKVQTAETAEAVLLYEAASTTQKLLLKQSPGSVQASLDVIHSTDGLGKIWIAANQLTQAQKLYDEMLGMLKSLQEKNSKNEELIRNLGLTYSRLGDIAVKKGELEQAASFYDEDLRIAMELFELHPNDLSSKRDICIALDRLGNMSTNRGKLEKALESYSESLLFRKELHAAEPSSMKAKRELFISYMKCGDTRMLQKDLSKAHDDYIQAMALADEMALLDPKSAIASQYQSLSAEVLADVAIENGKLEDALGYAKKSVEISKRLLEKDPTDGQKQRDLNICNLKVAKVFFNMEDYTTCLAQLAEVLPIVRAGFEKESSSLQAAREYSVVLLRIAEAQIAIQSPSEAEQQCQIALTVLLSVPEENRQDAVSRRRVVNTWTMLGQTQQMQGKNSEARQSWDEAKKLASAMIAENIRIEQMKADLDEIEALLGSLDNPEN